MSDNISKNERKGVCPVCGATCIINTQALRIPSHQIKNTTYWCDGAGQEPMILIGEPQLVFTPDEYFA